MTMTALTTPTTANKNVALNLSNVWDEIFPEYGTPRKQQFDWDESQRMWLYDRFVNCSGHLQYNGLRFCGKIAFRERVSEYHHCTYINDVTLYAFDGTMPVMVECHKFERTFHNAELIRSISEDMLRRHIRSTLKTMGITAKPEEIDREVQRLIDGCYKSFLDDDYNTGMLQLVADLKD